MKLTNNEINQLYKLISIMRKKANLTQKELALLLEKSESMVQKYELGSSDVSIKILNQIADICGLKMTVTLEEKESENNE